MKVFDMQASRPRLWLCACTAVGVFGGGDGLAQNPPVSVCLCLPSAHRLHPPYHFDISPSAAAAAAAASTYASDEVKWAFAASGGKAAAAGTTTRHATKATTSMIGKLRPSGERLGEIWTYMAQFWLG